MKYIKPYHLFESKKINSFTVSNQIKKEINIARKEFDIYKKYFEKVAGSKSGSNIGEEEEDIEDDYYFSTIDINTVDYNSHIQSVYYFDGKKVLYINLKFISI